MSLQQGLECLSMPASADLSASQFCFVNLDSNGRIQLPQTAGDDCVGVLQDKPDALDRAGQVALLEASLRVKVIAAATLTPGTKVQANTDGHAIAAASGDHVLGTVYEGGDDGDLIEILPGSRMLLP